MNTLESVTIQSDSLVIEIFNGSNGILSRTEHVIFCLNQGGPPSNPKYYLQIDSEQVPWGKGEKYPSEGSEIEPETISLQSFGALCIYTGWRTAFCIMSLRVVVSGKVKSSTKP